MSIKSEMCLACVLATAHESWEMLATRNLVLDPRFGQLATTGTPWAPLMSDKK